MFFLLRVLSLGGNWTWSFLLAVPPVTLLTHPFDLISREVTDTVTDPLLFLNSFLLPMPIPITFGDLSPKNVSIFHSFNFLSQKPLMRYRSEILGIIRNEGLFMILFVRNFRRVCSQFWRSVRNSV